MNARAPPLDMPRPLRLRVDDFLVLNKAGAFDDCAKTELIDGEIMSMNAQFLQHSYAKSQLYLKLMSALQQIGSPLIGLVEVSVALGEHNMPEPDIVLLRGPMRDGPVPLSSVALLIEVADTTLPIDLGRKALLYAAHGVPEYWVVDLQDRQIVQHWHPQADGYAQRTKVSFGVPIMAATVTGLGVDTQGLR